LWHKLAFCFLFFVFNIFLFRAITNVELVADDTKVVSFSTLFRFLRSSQLPFFFFSSSASTLRTLSERQYQSSFHFVFLVCFFF
jgi:hypothetical protein